MFTCGLQCNYKLIGQSTKALKMEVLRCRKWENSTNIPTFTSQL